MRALSLVFLALVLGAPAAGACVADPTKSVHGPVLLGNSSGVDMPDGYKVIVRDVGNVPLPGVTVTIQLLGSGASADLEQEPGTTVHCATGVLSRVSDGSGVVVFHARIAGYTADPVVQVRANGVLFGSIQVRSTDLNGDGATDLRDLNEFRERFLLNHAAPEIDFNQDGVANGYDFALFRAEFVRAVRSSVCQ
jgi:hypothetical protein